MSDTAAVRSQRKVTTALLRRAFGLAPKGLIRFLTVGVGGLAVDIAVLWLVREEFGVGAAYARLVSLSAATLVTWALNRQFTFGNSGRRKRIELGRYTAVAATAQSVNYLTYLGALAALPHLDYRISAFMGAVVATGFSYTGHRFFTFASKPPAQSENPSD